MVPTPKPVTITTKAFEYPPVERPVAINIAVRKATIPVSPDPQAVTLSVSRLKLPDTPAPAALQIVTKKKSEEPLGNVPFPSDFLGSTLQLSELGFTGTFLRQGNQGAWEGEWAGGCQLSRFAVIGLEPQGSMGSGGERGQYLLKLKRQDGNENECPFSPGFTAVYEGTVTIAGGSASITGLRTVVSPGSNEMVKNAVRDESVRVVPFSGEFSQK